MIYKSREQVERIGFTGVKNFAMEDGTVAARQLSSFWIATDPNDDGYTPHAISDGYWEAWITAWMSRQVGPDMNVVDIGANHGYYTWLMAAAGAQVYAIEPQAHLVDLMRKSRVLNEEIVPLSPRILHMAVSDELGTVTLNVPERHGMNASISNEFESHAPHGSRQETVATISLDLLFEDHNIDFIKIDVEGAEHLVWKGMQELWKRCRPVTVLEFRWDRYSDPRGFAEDLFASANVSYVHFDGHERPVHGVEHLETIQNADWMLVLR